jgi:hypothetical protein
MQTDISIRVPRYEGGYVSDIAKLTARTDRTDLKNISLFKETLIGVIDKWIETTDTGKKALDDSCFDFNVGDLSLSQEDPDLQKLLNNAGIFNLSIEISGAGELESDDWQFDSLLFRNVPVKKQGRLQKRSTGL